MFVVVTPAQAREDFDPLAEGHNLNLLLKEAFAQKGLRDVEPVVPVFENREVFESGKQVLLELARVAADYVQKAQELNIEAAKQTKKIGFYLSTFNPDASPEGEKLSLLAPLDSDMESELRIRVYVQFKVSKRTGRVSVDRVRPLSDEYWLQLEEELQGCYPR
jgi:hypothetical protein